MSAAIAQAFDGRTAGDLYIAFLLLAVFCVMCVAIAVAESFRARINRTYGPRDPRARR